MILQNTVTRAVCLVCSLVPVLMAGFAAIQPVAGSDLADGAKPDELVTQACTDPCLKAAITALYIRSPFLNPFQLDITVNDSVATLDGSVSDTGERALAGEIAAGVEGITAVINRILIEPEISALHHALSPVDCLTDDAALADRVRTQLHWNRATHGMAVTVSARDGIVNLSGTDTSPQQAELARLIAINTCGVRRVNSKFRTKPEQP
jgi:osmotically-inducible protein OsmY